GERDTPLWRGAQQQAPAAAGEAELARAAVKHERGRLPALAAHLELAPLDAQPQTGAERLHARLLGREASGEVRHRVAARAAVGDLLLGEHAAQEALVPAGDHLAHARDLDQIHAHAADHCTWGAPTWPPPPPNVRSAPGDPWRSSVTGIIRPARAGGRRRAHRP